MLLANVNLNVQRPYAETAALLKEMEELKERAISRDRKREKSEVRRPIHTRARSEDGSRPSKDRGGGECRAEVGVKRWGWIGGE